MQSIEESVLAGLLILLQIWAWERFSTIAPQLTHANNHLLPGRALGSRLATHVVSQYRYMFDLLQRDQIIWEPYKNVIGNLPNFCKNGQDIWRTISPLICFHIGVSIQQFDIDVTQEYIHWYNNITRLYITRPGAAVGHLRSNNARLRDVADDPQQVLNICNNNKRYMEEIHNMYDLSIVPPPVHRGRVRVEEAELDEVYHNVEEVPPTTQTQSQTGYGSPMTMMPTFGAGYYDSEVGTGYYDAGISPSSLYMDVGPSNFYMHGHKRGYGEHNKYLCTYRCIRSTRVPTRTRKPRGPITT
ncbi:mediator of RNA polymerase II transcription subunit 12-like isoform X1 [Cucumis melo var. makuwa]|uniref:Mediator of RNA polymerase II transcription subunit 12-like isoform X1 n=1 Tax=Cucumis melo var. makuwa TaxID=1194695 RepID=A0A5D3CH23_CUCMM|nr:mediator of RNA polymerase II transcription subunit 12-like isoform X1 [Cucumis melo var. makuwa]